mgnify:CR=1 FL=1
MSDLPVSHDIPTAPMPKITPQPCEKLRGAEKVARVPIKIAPTDPKQRLRKPAWIRAPFPSTPKVMRLKQILRDNHLHTVCEEASCPNLGECFGHGTAAFMIMCDICTRRCPFCDVGHGRPSPLDAQEPQRLAQIVAAMGLKYAVITSVDRDDLRDGGAAHFVDCIRVVRTRQLGIRIETLVPDFRGWMDLALDLLKREPPDVFNHNLETVPRLYRQARPGADYQYSLDLLRRFKERQPTIPTKSGLMLGLGETTAEIERVMRDLRAHSVGILTIGQYLQPSIYHLPVERYAPLEEFEHLRGFGEALGFTHVASAPLVRSSYHADVQAKGVFIT